MLTKQDFMDAALANIDQYPALAMLQRVGDPRIEQHLGAIATMLSMLSQQMEAATMEAFSKTRPATVLADAAMRGIVPRAKSARVRLSVENPGAEPLDFPSDYVLLDSTGSPYRLETPLSVPAGGVESVVARQGESRVVSHTVRESVPFYAIEVPAAEDGSYLSTIDVYDAQGAYRWANQYNNIEPGERVFHIEVDDRQRVYVRFGFADVVGVQTSNGAQLNLVIGYCRGDVVPEAGASFAPEYVNSPLEGRAKFSVRELIQRGQNPIGLEVLRDLARYPSVYSESAVFLGEFDFLVRKNFPSLQFASVWNESAEEAVRGASLDNINTLFVACLGADGQEQVVRQAPGTFAQAQLIEDGLLTPLQQSIKSVILAADDSYKVRFYTPVISEIPLTVNARVAGSYRPGDVRQQIIAQLVKAYGPLSDATRSGYFVPLYQQVYRLLRDGVPALMDGAGDPDWTITIADSQDVPRPELWRYVTEQSLSVSVQAANVVRPAWSING